MIRIASPAEHGGDMVEPAVYPFKYAVYPFKYMEWDLATARPRLPRALSGCRSLSG